MLASGFDAPFDFIWLRYVCDCAVVCAELGDEAAASKLASMPEPYADRLVTMGWGSMVSGSAAHYLALLASVRRRYDEAEARFAEAARVHNRIDAPAWLARTRVEWARMLLGRGQPGGTERAHDLLRQALATARERGLTNIERRAVELLSPQ